MLIHLHKLVRAKWPLCPHDKDDLDAIVLALALGGSLIMAAMQCAVILALAIRRGGKCLPNEGHSS